MINREQTNDVEHDAVHETAAEWFARLHERDISLEETLEWQRWMIASDKHARAFRRIEETWHLFADVPQPQWVAAEALAGDRYDGSMAISNYKRRTRNSKLWMSLAAAAATAAVGLGTFAIYKSGLSQPSTPPTQVFETAVGENRQIQLADGSQVVLGGHTRLEAAFDTRTRELHLARGEAFFNVVKDSARSFSVHAGAATVTALGTEFNVNRNADRVVVAVVEGRVLVQPSVSVLRQLPILRNLMPSATKQGARQLNAGDQTTVDTSGIQSAAVLADPALAAAWQTGRLAFEHQPLRYVLEDVNRYARKQIVLADAHLGDLEITGTLLNTNVEGWIASLDSAFGLTSVEESSRIVLRKASR